MVFGKPSVSFVGDKELVRCLTEHQKSYIKWRATRTSQNVSYFLMFPLLTRRAKTVWQVISYGEGFKAGFHPLIHGKITTLPMICGMM